MHNIYFSLYHVLIFFGVFQGILMASIFLLKKQFRRKSSVAIAVGLLAIAIAGIMEIMQDLGFHNGSSMKYAWLSNFSLLIIGYYFFVIYLIQPDRKVEKSDYVIVAPFITVFLLKIFASFLAFQAPSLLDRYFFIVHLFNLISSHLPVLYLLVISILVYRRLKHYHLQVLDNFSDIQGKELYWLQKLNYIFFPFSFYWFFSTTQRFITEEKTAFFYGSWLFGCFIIYLIAYIVILKRDVFAIPVFGDYTKSEKDSLPTSTDKYYDQLLALIETQKLYRDPDLNMDTLSKTMGLSNSYLSKIINHSEGKNFYEFINSYRVQEAKTYLSDSKYAHYSIDGIGLEAGFKSKSTFYSVFKKMCGVTPKAFKKESMTQKDI